MFLGAVLKTKQVIFLNIMDRVKAQRSGEHCLSRTCLFYSITLQSWTWKQLIADRRWGQIVSSRSEAKL